MGNKKEYKRIEDLVIDNAPLWQQRLCLEHYVIKHVFVEMYSAQDDAGQSKVLADADASWEYLEAKVTWYLPACTAHNDDDLLKAMVHELCHVLLCSEQSVIKDADHQKVELATEMTARALWRTFHAK